MSSNKVLIVIPSFYPAVIYGGPIFSTLKTCLSLNKVGVDFKVCTTNANGVDRLNTEINKYVFDLGFPVKYFNDTILGKFSIPLAISVCRDIFSSDVIHIQSIFSTPTPIALFYSWLFSKKTIISPRGSLGEWCLNNNSLNKKLWLRLFIKPFLNNVIWHATSVQEKNEIISSFGDQNINIIPNGIDLDEFSSSGNDCYFFDHYNIIPDTKVVVSMGRLEKKKGFDILIRAVEALIKTGCDIKLFIAGPDYGELEHLSQLSKDLNIQDNVYFVGNLSGQEKIDFLSSADVFAMPSHNENFGNVYLESLACGTPIVASKNTPWQDIEKYSCGRWVANTVEDTASAIFDLIHRDSAILSDNCVNYSRTFTWDSIGISFQQLYLGKH